MSLLSLERLEMIMSDLEAVTSAVPAAGSPMRGFIQLPEEDDSNGAARFAIRVPKYALDNELREALFRKIRELFSLEERCFLQNAGDQGVFIEADVAGKRKAMIALWELGVYNFQLSYLP